MHSRNCIAIFRALRKANPRPATELVYGSPFELLVSVVLSAQSTDLAVNKATSRLFAVANTPRTILALGLAGLRRHIRSIGLYNTKARNLIRTSRMLLDNHGGEVPSDRAALEQLPGVGRKTANVILNTAFGLPVIAVDTHIFRVANRTGLAPGRNVRKVEDRLNEVVPGEFRKDAHHWLILHGRYTCTARAPRCAACCIYDYCEWPDKRESRVRGGGGKPETRRPSIRT
ncbi:MAG: endonuclease III, partial [Gammaproteobacteria bacterium]